MASNWVEWSCRAFLSLLPISLNKVGFDPWIGKIQEEGMATRTWQLTPVFLPEKIPRIEEPWELQSMGLKRVGHDCSDWGKHSPARWITSACEWAKIPFISPSFLIWSPTPSCTPISHQQLRTVCDSSQWWSHTPDPWWYSCRDT